LSRGWRKEAERAEFLEGKIKAQSPFGRFAGVCTSFFWETHFCKGRNYETLGEEATLFWGLGQPLDRFGLQMALLP
jgi:hypothetical protein